METDEVQGYEYRIEERGKENETILLITPGLAERIILRNHRTTHIPPLLRFGFLCLFFSPFLKHLILKMFSPLSGDGREVGERKISAKIT